MRGVVFHFVLGSVFAVCSGAGESISPSWPLLYDMMVGSNAARGKDHMILVIFRCASLDDLCVGRCEKPNRDFYHSPGITLCCHQLRPMGNNGQPSFAQSKQAPLLGKTINLTHSETNSLSIGGGSVVSLRRQQADETFQRN